MIRVSHDHPSLLYTIKNLFFVCSLAVLLISCTQPATEKTSSSPILISHTTPLPVDRTACPSDNTARPALTPSFSPGDASSVVYINNDGWKDQQKTSPGASGLLKLYNTRTQQSSNLLKLPGASITDAQVSSNGQWVLFWSHASNTYKLQLIRLDGKNLQTLFCLSASSYLPPADSIQWSPDQKSILLSMIDKQYTSTITLLNALTGSLTTELQIKRLDPRSQDHYAVLKWLDNTSAYIEKFSSIHALYLLNITQNNNKYALNPTPLLTGPPPSGGITYWSIDASSNAKTLITSNCILPPATTIQVYSLTDMAISKTYAMQLGIMCIEDIRLIAPNLLLMRGAQGSYPFRLWKMKLDGSGATLLTDVGDILNRFTQYPWSNTSRDGSMYSLQMDPQAYGNQKLWIGSLNGGDPTVFASSSTGGLDIVGWTTI